MLKLTEGQTPDPSQENHSSKDGEQSLQIPDSLSSAGSSSESSSSIESRGAHETFGRTADNSITDNWGSLETAQDSAVSKGG